MDCWRHYLSRIFIGFFLKPVYPPSLWKSFKFMLLRLLKITKTLMSPSKTLPEVFIITIQVEVNYLFLPSNLFWRSIFPQKKWGEGRIMEVKKLAKLNLRGYYLEVLINSTNFSSFTFLVFVLLHHNLNSSILKCESFLT